MATFNVIFTEHVGQNSYGWPRFRGIFQESKDMLTSNYIPTFAGKMGRLHKALVVLGLNQRLLEGMQSDNFEELVERITKAVENKTGQNAVGDRVINPGKDTSGLSERDDVARTVASRFPPMMTLSMAGTQKRIKRDPAFIEQEIRRKEAELAERETRIEKQQAQSKVNQFFEMLPGR